MKSSLIKAGIATAAVGLLISGFYWVLVIQESQEPEINQVPPDFATITDVKKKKDTFFSFMAPIIKSANNKIRADKIKLKGLIERYETSKPLSDKERRTLKTLVEKYRVGKTKTVEKKLEELVIRIDVIPPSLALAQAANESAWGTARFARNANNYYGLWCWTKSCGLVPSRRDEGAKHEVARFNQIEDGVRYYMRTLNSHPAYEQLRQIRFERREKGLPLNGSSLANGLLSYSERREEYVNEIKAMIRINQLEVTAAL